MTDDIVTRLRAYNIGNIGHEAASHMEETLYEAADEIERLRQLGDSLAFHVRNDNAKEMCTAVYQWDEARDAR